VAPAWVVPGGGAVRPESTLAAPIDLAVRAPAGPTGWAGPAVVAVGRRFQPLPGTPPVGSSPAGAVLIAPPGTLVHAIGSGVVLRPGGGGELRLRTDDGLDLGYAGLAPDSVVVADGDRVTAGAVLGVLAGAAGGPPQLLLDVRDAAGAVVDPAGLLLGLPDPYELGSAAGDGLGIDPDALDQALGATDMANVGLVSP
jgi:murein DD-endopeptidase MepM/ murein hydrolase activator NlpD